MSRRKTPAARSKRYRRFSVTSIGLTRRMIESAMARPNVLRYVGGIHDSDPGSKTHGNLFLELKDPRDADTVGGYFPIPVQVSPVVGNKGDRSSFIRAARYLTHEAPAEEVKGQFRYSDEEIFASPGFDWRAEADALTAKEGYRTPKLNLLKQDVLLGRLTVQDIYAEHSDYYAEHQLVFDRLERSGQAIRHRARIDEERKQAEEAKELLRLQDVDTLGLIQGAVDQMGRADFLGALMTIIEQTGMLAPGHSGERDLAAQNLHSRIGDVRTWEWPHRDKSFFVDGVAKVMGLFSNKSFDHRGRVVDLVRSHAGSFLDATPEVANQLNETPDPKAGSPTNGDGLLVNHAENEEGQ